MDATSRYTLTLTLDKTGAEWTLTARPPQERGELRKWLHHPIMRCRVDYLDLDLDLDLEYIYISRCRVDDEASSIISGEWQVRLPVEDLLHIDYFLLWQVRLPVEDSLHIDYFLLWQVRLPVEDSFELQIKGKGSLVPSFEV